MDSDKWIISTADSNLTMVSLKTSPEGQPPGTVTKRPMKAEAAIMNPKSKILALRSGTILQIFNLDLQTKMKSHTAPSPILFWRWTSPTNIALVTVSSCFHWSIAADEPPVKIFDRHPDIPTNSQVGFYLY
mgnify:FL=1